MADKNTSTVVVALPAPGEDVIEFGPEQKHATLLYFGEVDDFTAGWINAQLLKVVSDGQQPFTEQVEGMTTLGKDDPPATVLKLRPGTLEQVRRALLADKQVSEAWESIEQYPSFTPHVTLGYGDELSDDDLDDAPSVVKTITFDRLALWHKDKQIEYPLEEEYLVPLSAAGAPKIVRSAEGAKRYGVPIGTEITVDEDGKVTSKASLRVPAGEAPASGRGGASPTQPPPPRPDPDRSPTKFVPTVPGQKAKLPSGVAGSDTKNGLNPAAQKSITDYTRVLDAIGQVSPAQDAAMEAVQRGQTLSAGQKAALRSMIEQIFKSLGEDPSKPKSESKDEKKSEEKSAEQTAAEKAATAKAQAASTESTSPEKKAAQAKAQAAAAQKSAWLRSLRAAYAALGGNPKGLPNQEAASAEKTTESAPSAASAPAASGTKLPTSGFSGMNDKQLVSSIRSLIAAQKADPNSSKIKNALRMARAVRERRARDKAEREASQLEFLANAGGPR